MFLWFHVGETPSGQKIVVLSELYIKQIKNIMKYQLHTNASKKVDDYRLFYLNDLLEIKLIFYNLKINLLSEIGRLPIPQFYGVYCKM